MAATTISATKTTAKYPSKPNIAVYTNPSHELWVGDAQPSLESLTNDELKPGEVTIAIKSSGICGFVFFLAIPL